MIIKKVKMGNFSNDKLYREFKVDYKDFNEDNIETNNLIDTKSLMDNAKKIFLREMGFY